AGERFVVQPMDVELSFADEAGKKWIVIRPRQQPQAEQRGERISLELSGSRPPDLPEYAGLYWSDELETQYRASFEEGKLRLRHIRHGTIELRPIGRDVFATGSWFMSEVVFVRDAQGRIAGLRAGGGRVRGIAFTRR